MTLAMTEFAKRRKALMKQVGSKGVVVIPAAPEMIRNGDVHFPYRQQSDFYYLTGFEEPEAIMVLVPNRSEGEYVLFNRVRDLQHEVWDGPRAGQTGACKQFLANQSFPIEKFEEIFPMLISGRDKLHYPIAQDKKFDERVMRLISDSRRRARSGIRSPSEFVDVVSVVHEMRLFKSPAEIQMMQKAIDITAKGHVAVMEACRPEMNECELDAILSYEFKRQGASHVAYSSIVGSGKNTCILHYVKNDKRMKRGELVLVDAGAEYQNYAADITRTFPADGRFSEEQRAIYDIVLEAQLAGIRAIKPGASWDAPQAAIVKVITQGLKEVGILSGRVNDLISKKAYLPYYMHQSGHWLGLDVHDVGQYKINEKWRSFKPGMVLTVEPGIYLASHVKGLAKRWHHIGVRIEDDVLVTRRGNKVLSAAIPKTVKEIEILMGAR